MDTREWSSNLSDLPQLTVMMRETINSKFSRCLASMTCAIDR